MSNSIHLGKLDWPGQRLKNGKAITIAESSSPFSISRLRMAIHLNKAVPFRDGMIAEWGESFEDEEWKMHSIPAKGHILTPEESVIPIEVLTLAKWLQKRSDCPGGVWLRVDAERQGLLR